jgi:pimeloyl-ACP methyl ester carboxylesterase
VPRNWADPDGPTLQLALARHPATDPAVRIGSLVMDPGGPGVSGVDDLGNELTSLTPGILARYDIVTFDPPGVGQSDPVTCGEGPGGAPGPLADPVPQTAAARRALESGDRHYAVDCETASGDILPFVGTVDVARDLDRIRQALGDAALTYEGQSYGTLIGEVYAELYPTHVRAMVLDSPLDPALSFTATVQGQAEGFEQSLDAFFSWCAGAGCAFRPTGDPTAAVLALLAGVRARPLSVGGRTVGPGELYDALLEGLYSRSRWAQLGQALEGIAAAGDGAGVLTLSDDYNQPSTPNLDDANNAVNCVDHDAPVDFSAYPALAATAAETAPVFGPLLAWGEATCAVWPVPPDRVAAPVRAPGTPEVLVVGTTGDPATPYAWARAVAAQFPHGVLLTRQGNDHVASFYSACVRSAVEAYLVAGAAPAPGTVCSD